MNRKYIIFNVNMIIAGLTGAVIASKIGFIFDELFNQNELTSFIVSASHFILAFAIFTSLFYITNRKKYKAYFSRNIWADFVKIYGTFIPSLILFYILFFVINDLMLHWSFSVTMSGILGWIIGTLASRIIHTLFVHKAGIFRE